jgi:hypothetical protein
LYQSRLGSPSTFRLDDPIGQAEFDATIELAEEGQGRLAMTQARISQAQGPSHIVLWFVRPEENVIANPRFLSIWTEMIYGKLVFRIVFRLWKRHERYDDQMDVGPTSTVANKYVS